MDISASSPAAVVLWPTEAPAVTPWGPLPALKLNARWVKKAGAMNAPTPAPMRRKERMLIGVDEAWTVKSDEGDETAAILQC